MDKKVESKTTTKVVEAKKNSLEWKSLEYQNYERNWKWFLSIFVIFAVVIGYSVYTGDWFTIFIAIILIGFLFWYVKQKPEEKNYKVGDLGINVNDRLYPYNEIYSFWLTLNPEFTQLNIIFNKKYLPALSILIPVEVDVLKVKTELGKHIPEQDNKSETMMDYLMRLFKL